MSNIKLLFCMACCSKKCLLELETRDAPIRHWPVISRPIID